jgi:hypothetical protein
VTDAEWVAEPGLADEINAKASTWRQGDVFTGLGIVRLADSDRPLTRAAAEAGGGLVAISEQLPHAAVISQTCEVVRPSSERPSIHVAAVVSLEGARLNEARRKWRPQYVAVPWLGDNKFADLERQGIVEKAVVLAAERVAECPDAEEAMRFAAGLARHRSRFAFPDDLAPTLQPLIRRIRDKSGKPTPQGRRIDEVVEIRARASPDWFADSVSIELLYLVDSRSMPGQPPGEEPSADLLVQVSTLGAQRLAEELEGEPDPMRRNVLWQRLVDTWTEMAKPVGTVREVTAVAIAVNEFTRADDATSAELDLEYLSE